MTLKRHWDNKRGATWMTKRGTWMTRNRVTGMTRKGYLDDIVVFET
ncbi:MAG: hypothetical protein ACR5K9_00880 [Wolbachia sp.]